MSQHDGDGMEAVLEQQLAQLPRNVRPERDLWPGIEAQLSHETQARVAVRPWPWFQVAAALAAGYALATWLPLNAFRSAVDPMPEPADSFALVENVRPALAGLPAKTRSVIESDLSGLEQDWRSIEQALAADPDNVLLRELQMSAEDRAAALVDQVNRLTRASAEEIEI